MESHVQHHELLAVLLRAKLGQMVLEFGDLLLGDPRSGHGRRSRLQDATEGREFKSSQPDTYKEWLLLGGPTTAASPAAETADRCGRCMT